VKNNSVTEVNFAQEGWIKSSPLLCEGERRIPFPAKAVLVGIDCSYDDGDSFNKIAIMLRRGDSDVPKIIYQKRVKKKTVDYIGVKSDPQEDDCFLEVHFFGWALNPKVILTYTQPE